MEQGESGFWWKASSLWHSLAFCPPNICAILPFACGVFTDTPPQRKTTQPHSFTACISQSTTSAWHTICSTGFRGFSCVPVTSQIDDKYFASPTITNTMYNGEGRQNNCNTNSCTERRKNGRYIRVTGPKSDRNLGRHHKELCHGTEESLWLNHASLAKKSSSA